MTRLVQAVGLASWFLALGGALLWWNLSHFLGAGAQLREKDLSFLPSPEVAQLLSMGQAGAIAKLRWIDSFAYFQYQLDHHDDRVQGGGAGGVERLYDTLIALDPYFLPYYEHAALNASGVLAQHGLALSFLMRGIDNLPQSGELWRNAATILRIYYHWDEKLPVSMHNFLRAWRDAEPTPQGKLMVLMWEAGMDKRRSQGSDEIAYWFEQLHATKAGTPIGDFVEDTLREQLAMFGRTQLQGLADDYATASHTKPGRMEELLDQGLVKHRHPSALPSMGPIWLDQGRIRLRDDPFGLPWRLEKGMVVSTGLYRRAYGRKVALANSDLLKVVKQKGHWPADVAQAVDMGVHLPDPSTPPGGRLTLLQQSLVVQWDAPSGAPWPLR